MTRILVFSGLLLLHVAAQGQSYTEAFPGLTFTLGVDIQHAGDESDRLFVVEQAGRILVFPNDPLITEANVFLDIRSRVLSDPRFGMLGMAFHPRYAENGYFFVHYTSSGPQRSVIARFQVDESNPEQANAASEVVLLEVGQPHNFHNGGALAFGPDGYLYIPLGDGGPGRDPNGEGQNRSTLLGTVLRIDVDSQEDGRNYAIPDDNPFVGNTSGFREEIWSWGWRNPWRISFDPVTGWLWTGENGEDLFEEINIIDKGKNYGWKVTEGTRCFSPAVGCSMAGLEPPVWEYGGTSQRRSVIGGYVYRGQRNPELEGSYIYGDFAGGQIWALDYEEGTAPSNRLLATGMQGLSTFGLDEQREIYFSNIVDGKIYRFAPTSTALESDVPVRAVEVHPGYPNPFTRSTTIPFSVPQPDMVTFEVFDLTGRKIKTLLHGHMPAGVHTVTWDGMQEGRPAPSGIYIYRLTSGETRLTGAVTLLR